MSKSIAGTVTPFALARRAKSYAVSQTGFIDREIRDRLGQLPQDRSFLDAPRTVPKFKLHWCAPSMLTRGQRSLDTRADGLIATWAKHVNQRGSIDEDHSTILSGEGPGVLVARSSRCRCRSTA